MQRATCIDEQIEVGLHLLLETRFDPSLPSRDLDWLGEFHQVLLVTSPGVCFGVGGSLDPDHGLSSSYSDAKKGVYVVINEPPATVENMEELMVSFCYGGGRWKRMSTYE